MKPITIYLVCSILFLQNVHSQDSLKSNHTETHHPLYKARFNFSYDQSVRAYLMAIKDSSVFIYAKKGSLPDPLHKEKKIRNLETSWDSYHYKMIVSIKVNNQKLRAWTIVTGTVAGIVAGVLIGKNSSSGTGYTGTISYAFGVAVGAIVGGGVGALTGLAVASAFEKKYLINGDWKSLAELKATLKY